MSGERLELILEQHDIHPKFWPEIKAWILDKVRPCDEVLTRFHHVSNYQICMGVILAELSRQVTHKFPPPVTHPLEVV